MDIPVALEAHDLRRHLGEGGVRPLADLRLAALHGHGAVQIQLHPIGGGLKRDGIDGGIVPEGRHADAPADGPRVLGKLRLLAVIVDVGLALVQTLPEGVIVVDVAGEAS